MGLGLCISEISTKMRLASHTWLYFTHGCDSLESPLTYFNCPDDVLMMMMMMMMMMRCYGPTDGLTLELLFATKNWRIVKLQMVQPKRTFTSILMIAVSTTILIHYILYISIFNLHIKQTQTLPPACYIVIFPDWRTRLWARAGTTLEVLYSYSAQWASVFINISDRVLCTLNTQHALNFVLSIIGIVFYSVLSIYLTLSI